MPAPAVTPVSRAIDAALACATEYRARRLPQRSGSPLALTVALSGGRDSMVLLDALATAVPLHAISLAAVHVHHGLSPRADAWADFCAKECAARGVPLAVHRVQVDRTAGSGLEAAARAARYAVFGAIRADFVALAHHADDQAETLMLQLLRGAGPHGLAAMPVVRSLGADVALLRPLLTLAAAALDAYAKTRGLAWVDDESNADATLRRNFLRHEIAPRLGAAFAGYPATLARAALLQGEAAQLLDELALADARGLLVSNASEERGDALDRDAFASLARSAPHRARNVLRWFLHRHNLRAPSAARLDAMQRQLAGAVADARVRLAHDGVEVGIHRGLILVHSPPPPPWRAAWRGEAALALPHGTLEFAAVAGAGLAATKLERAPVIVRPREGGERIRFAPDRPRQAVKRLLQAADIPHWQRDALPLVFCGDALAAIPGIGVDAAFAATVGEHGFEVRWHPGSRGLTSVNENRT
jgi:tRNA(Ile)-lysidine synthase